MERREGVALAYDEAGQGDPPVILVHGWGVGRWAMRPLFEDMRRRRRTVSVDLSGFGESDATGQARTIHGHADDVAAVIAGLGLGRAVVVGHSMGGVVALDVAARYGDRVSALGILEGLVLPPEETASAIRGVLDGLRGDRYREVVAGYQRYVIGPRLDPELRSRIVDGAVSQPRGAFADMLSDMLAYDGAAAVARVSCPILYVGTGEPYSDLTRLRAICPALATETLAGCGHYFPLEAPEQLHPVLARFVGTSVA
jgi:pimeloyl-ACP methyl ester carboxylesterase